MIAYRIVDDIAERYLDLVDDLDGEIDELEDIVDRQPPADAPARSPTCATTSCTSGARLRRCATPSGASSMNAVEVEEGDPVFPQAVEVAFNAAYDKLMRALDGLELAATCSRASATTRRRSSRSTRTR